MEKSLLILVAKYKKLQFSKFHIRSVYIQRSDTEDDWHWTESGDENDTQSVDEKSDEKVDGLLVENLPSNKIQSSPKVFI